MDDSGVPSSKRIIQDITKVVNDAWPTIYKAGGTACHHLCSRNGRINAITAKDKNHNGGNIVKIKDFGVLDDFICPSVQNHEIDLFKNSIRIYQGLISDKEQKEYNSDKEI